MKEDLKKKLLNLGDELSKNELKKVLGGTIYHWSCSGGSGTSNQDCTWWNTNGPGYCSGTGRGTYTGCY